MRFGFYVNPVAQLRNEENNGEPEPVIIAALAETAGAEIIVAGWVPGDGGLSDRDITLIRETIHCDLLIATPLDGAAIEPVARFRPVGVILVASGWDGNKSPKTVQPEIEKDEITALASAYKAAGIQVSVFADPDLSSLKSIARCGLDGVTIDCSAYSRAHTDEEAESTLDQLSDSVMAASKFGLVPSLGNGLDYRNIGPIAGIKYIDELYIGRSIINRSLVQGIQKSISDMINLIHRHRYQD